MKDQVDKLIKDNEELKFELQQMSFQIQELKQALNDSKIVNNFGVAGQQIDIRDVQSFIRTATDSTEITRFLSSTPQRIYDQIFIDNTQTLPTKDRLYIYDTLDKTWRYCELV